MAKCKKVTVNPHQRKSCSNCGKDFTKKSSPAYVTRGFTSKYYCSERCVREAGHEVDDSLFGKLGI